MTWHACMQLNFILAAYMFSTLLRAILTGSYAQKLFTSPNPTEIPQPTPRSPHSAPY